MTTISFLKPYGNFSYNQATKYDDSFIKDRLNNFINNKPNYSNGFIISDAEYKKENFKRKISKNSKVIHSLKFSKNNYIELGSKSVGVTTSIYIALVLHKKGDSCFFDFAPYLVTMDIDKDNEYSISVDFQPSGIDAVNDAVALGAEAEVMKITPDANIQDFIPDLLHATFIKATDVVYAISEDLALFNK